MARRRLDVTAVAPLFTHTHRVKGQWITLRLLTRRMVSARGMLELRMLVAMEIAAASLVLGC